LISLSLPYPPSTNELFRNVPRKGRVKTQRYLTWIQAAGNEVNAQRPQQAETHIGGPVEIVITVERRNNRRDLDNCVKAIIDLLVAHGAIDDDRNVMRITVAWGPATGVTVLPAMRRMKREAA